MANGDSLADLIALARRELTDVPPEVWTRFAALASRHYGAHRLYVHARIKARHLERLAEADAQTDVEQLADMLGVSVRQVFRYKAITGR